MSIRKLYGFTLIELLVVIAIIAILAAILFPVLTAARMKAQQAQCSSNLHQVSVAMLAYADDSNGRWPVWRWKVAAYPTIRGRKPGSLSERCWRDALWPYLKNFRAMVCPARLNEVGTVTAEVSDIPAWEAADKKIGLLVESYGFNYALDYWSPQNSTTSGRASEATYPTKTMLLAENGRGGYPEIVDLTDAYGFSGKPKGWTKGHPWVNWNRYDVFAIELHGQGGNVTFCDGHVKFYKWMDWVARGELLLASLVDGDSSVRSKPLYREAWIMGGLYVIPRLAPYGPQ